MSEEKEYFTNFPNLTLLPWLIWGVIIGLIIAALFYSARLHADEARAADGSVAYVRHDAPCDDADINAHIIRLGAGQMLSQFKKGTLTYGGRDWRSCWIEVQEFVYSVDEEGAPFEAIPARIFKAKPGA